MCIYDAHIAATASKKTAEQPHHGVRQVRIKNQLIKMEPINLKQYGLQELSFQENESINGGAKLPKWLKGLGLGAVLKDAFDHWEDIKKGFKEGWEIDKPHK